MPYNLATAGTAVGRSKSSIMRAIRRGAISATRNPATGQWAIDPAELFRVYPAIAPPGELGGDPDLAIASRDVAPGSTDATEATSRYAAVTAELREVRGRLEATEARLTDSRDQVADLRRRLDVATEQLGEAWQQVRQLTDQRSGRSWWGRMLGRAG